MFGGDFRNSVAWKGDRSAAEALSFVELILAHFEALPPASRQRILGEIAAEFPAALPRRLSAGAGEAVAAAAPVARHKQKQKKM